MEELEPRLWVLPASSGRGTGFPAIVNSDPRSGAWKPARILITVDLPEPF